MGLFLGWFSVLAAPLAACASGPARDGGRRTESPGWSDGAPAASASAPRPVERWDVGAALRGLQPAGPRARSEHLGGEHEGEVLAPAGARDAKSASPPGTTLVERLFDPGGTAPVAYFVMIKRPPGYDAAGGDWEYLAVAPDGRVEDRGQLRLCARCHAEAPYDHRFGSGR